jgi:hypothetical protein
MTEPTRDFDPAHEPGTPPGMTSQDVSARFEYGRWFGKEIWPADRASLVNKAEEMSAPAEVTQKLRNLPDREYTNTQDVMTALGIGVEQSRP